MRLIDADAEIEKREYEIKIYEDRIKDYMAKNEPDNIRIIRRINQCNANIHDIKTEIQILRNLPAAYDVENVVEQLKAEGCITDNASGNRAVEIIKAGGMDE